jgi:hypothetical protein
MRLAQSPAWASIRRQSDPLPGHEALIARLPYQTTYSESQVRRILNQSEDRPSPVTGAKGHPRQHVGRLGKAEEHAEEEGKTKSVFTNTEQQDKAVKGQEEEGRRAHGSAARGPENRPRRGQGLGAPERERDEGIGDRRVNRQRPARRHPHPDRLSRRRLAAALF